MGSSSSGSSTVASRTQRPGRQPLTIRWLVALFFLAVSVWPYAASHGRALLIFLTRDASSGERKASRVSKHAKQNTC